MPPGIAISSRTTPFASFSINWFAWRCSRPMIWPCRLTVTVSNAIAWYVMAQFPPDCGPDDAERHGWRAQRGNNAQRPRAMLPGGSGLVPSF
jgi:hypothetical protein